MFNRENIGIEIDIQAKKQYEFLVIFSSIPISLSWLKYISWLKYANEAMTIVQWEGVTNISEEWFFYCRGIFEIKRKKDCFNFSFFQISACHFDSQLPCFTSAEDIYDQYNFSEDDFNTDFYALTTLYIAFNVLAFILLWLRVRKYW